MLSAVFTALSSEVHQLRAGAVAHFGRPLLCRAGTHGADP